MKQDPKNQHATKQDLLDLEDKFDKKLTKRLHDSFEAFRQENAYQFKLMREELHETIAVFTNKILTALDPIIKDNETCKQDRALATAQTKRLSDDITDLQTRVTKLEQTK